jgi:sec-independent protein translocase protein TatA
MPNVGPMEIAIVVLIALVIFGPKRLPELGRAAGKGIREFKGAIGPQSHDSKQSAD